ncbi:hypothetical protein OIDMADRAFT_36189 [Oidiodendron maius Zn]|uniref:Uncharacterized protein n=1 Tax=Oidiodendron maius (strain Zn) TaxID=913774 RepID=A0A0C3GR27_OIDMZ|nr:hypothetical protein OIDMADRAFT_36189 [Oidiodendron maius Zn]
MQQEPNDAAAVLRAESMGVTLATTEDESPGPDSGDSSRKSSLGDFSPQSDVCSDDGLDDSTMIDGDNEGPRTTKRKRQPSPVNVPTRKKHKVSDGRDGRGVSFSQLGQLIESIGYIGKLDDITIKPLQKESFLLTGVGHYTSSRVSPSERKTLPPHAKLHILDNDEAQTRLRHGRAGREDTSRESTSAISDDERLSDSDPDPSGGDDGCCSEDEQHRLSTRRNIPWDEIEEQRLRV